jgi:Tetratricopeptide repeat
MANSSSRPADPARPDQPSWLPYTLAALSGVCVGIAGTYLVLRPQLQPPGPPAAIGATPAAISAPFAGQPPPELTSGLTAPQADRTLGNFYYDQSNWAQAIHYYESAIKQGSDDADIRTDLGNAYRFSHQPDLALAQYQTAQLLNPAHEFSLFNQGGLYFEDLNQPEKAIAVWKEYLVRFPQGRNVDATRQLLDHAAGHPGGMAATPPPAVGAGPAASAPSTTEARILELINAQPPPPAKPAKP